MGEVSFFRLVDVKITKAIGFVSEEDLPLKGDFVFPCFLNHSIAIDCKGNGRRILGTGRRKQLGYATAVRSTSLTDNMSGGIRFARTPACVLFSLRDMQSVTG